MKPRAFVFDAYGTVFDTNSVVVRAGEGIDGNLHSLSTLWRQKQLEFTWLRALMERYDDFWNVTDAALRSAVKQLKIQVSEAQLDRLMQAYLSPSAFPDVRPALERLKGFPLAILSNGTGKMLESAVNYNDLGSCFTEIISVDSVKTYKPSARVYALGPHILNTPAEQILFVSSNSWDAAGAKAFGYRVCSCNRSGAEIEHLGFPPDMIVSELHDLVNVMAVAF